MARKPETVFKIRFRKRLDGIPYSWWIKTSFTWISGIPDFLGCLQGYFVAIELKKDGVSEPSKLQKRVLRLIKMAGGKTYVCHPGNEEEVLASLLQLRRTR